MEQIKEFNLYLSIFGGVEKVLEILYAAYEHEKKSHHETKQKLSLLEEQHTKLSQEHEELKQANPSLDSHKDVLG